MIPSTLILAALAFLLVFALCAPPPITFNHISTFDGYHSLQEKLDQLKQEHYINRPDATLESFFAPSPPDGFTRCLRTYLDHWYTRYFEYELYNDHWRIYLGVDFRDKEVNEVSVDVRSDYDGTCSDIWKLKPGNPEFTTCRRDHSKIARENKY